MMDAGDAKRNYKGFEDKAPPPGAAAPAPDAIAASPPRWVGVFLVAASLGGALLLSLRAGNSEGAEEGNAFFSPVETNPWLRPGAQLPTLRHVAISTGGQTAVAAGAGAFLWSGDGGSAWNRVPRTLLSRVGDLTLTNDGTQMRAETGEWLLASSNGGNSWTLEKKNGMDDKGRQQTVAQQAPRPAAQQTIQQQAPPQTIQQQAPQQAPRPQSDCPGPACASDGAVQGFNASAVGANGAGVAVGAGGIVATRAGSGGTWTPVRQGGPELLAVAVDASSGRAIAVGAGTILRGKVAGGGWEPARYRAWPAPWFWVLLAAAGGWILWRARRRLVEEGAAREEPGLLGQAVPDAPVTDPRDDHLDFGPGVQALSRFLRHSGTRPPLAIAVNAPWGMGKSSFMGMLSADLRGHGARPVWFNVWHHQHDEVLLAPLLQAITHQAIPSIFTWQGLRFRARLVRERWRRGGWAARMAAVALASVPAYLLWVLLRERREAESGLLDGALRDLFAAFHHATAGPWLGAAAGGGLGDVVLAGLGAVQQDPLSALGALGVVLLLACWFMLLQYMLRPFPSSPAVLLVGLGSKLSLSQAEAQTDFRRRFRQHFAEVARALQPRTMVVFIDDVDRCNPHKAAELLEGVNYLADAGPCFVIMGMARDIVEAQLATAHKAVAEEQAALKRAQRAATGHPAAASPDDEELDRLAYARSYLRKLVQLDVPLPSVNGEKALRMLLQGAVAGSGTGRAASPRAMAAALRAGFLGAGRWLLAHAGLLAGVLVLALLAWQATVTGAQVTREKEQVAARLQAQLATVRSRLAEVRAYDHWLRSQASARSALPEPDKVRYQARADAVLADLKAVEQAVVLMDAEALAGNAAKYDSIQRARFDPARERLRQRLEDPQSNLAEWFEIRNKVRADEQGTPAAADPTRNAVSLVAAGVAGPGTAEWPLPAGLVLLLLLLLAWALGRRDNYVVKPTLEYERSLAFWQQWLLRGSGRASPRELKRFLNRSRYVVARLGPAEAQPAQAKLSESRIVEFSAKWMQAQHLPDAPAIIAAMLAAPAAPPALWTPPTMDELEAFLAVVGELPDDGAAPGGG